MKPRGGRKHRDRPHEAFLLYLLTILCCCAYVFFLLLLVFPPSGALRIRRDMQGSITVTPFPDSAFRPCGLPALPPPFAASCPSRPSAFLPFAGSLVFRVLVFARASWPVPNSLFISFRAVCSLFSSSPVFFKQFAFFLKLPSPFRAVCSLFPNFLVSFAGLAFFSDSVDSFERIAPFLEFSIPFRAVCYVFSNSLVFSSGSLLALKFCSLF